MPDVSTGSVYSVYTVMYIHQESSDLALHNPYIGHLVDKVPGTFNNTIIPPFTGPVQYYSPANYCNLGLAYAYCINCFFQE